jgi:hypothetical protein
MSVGSKHEQRNNIADHSLATLVGTQLRLTHVLQPIRVQTQSIPLALFPPLT